MTLLIVVWLLIDENILRLGAIALSSLIVLFIEPLAVKYPTKSALRRAIYWIIEPQKNCGKRSSTSKPPTSSLAISA